MFIKFEQVNNFKNVVVLLTDIIALPFACEA
jgi:hypothetical protein